MLWVKFDWEIFFTITSSVNFEIWQIMEETISILANSGEAHVVIEPINTSNFAAVIFTK